MAKDIFQAELPRRRASDFTSQPLLDRRRVPDPKVTPDRAIDPQRLPDQPGGHTTARGVTLLTSGVVAAGWRLLPGTVDHAKGSSPKCRGRHTDAPPPAADRPARQPVVQAGETFDPRQSCRVEVSSTPIRRGSGGK